jgi:hypothetical protein
MRVLTENQKLYIIENFFIHPNYSGWRGIAEKLLEKGSCIVAGEGRIWNGGVGTFIKVEEISEAVGCVSYKFNLDLFLDSEFFKECKDYFMKELVRKKLALETLVIDIDNL